MLHAAYVGWETLSISMDLDCEPQGYRVEDEIDGILISSGTAAHGLRLPG
jgi:hypothetical protein